MKTNCHECKFFYSESDINYAECKKEATEEIKDEYWQGKVECPFFESGGAEE